MISAFSPNVLEAAQLLFAQPVADVVPDSQQKHVRECFDIALAILTQGRSIKSWCHDGGYENRWQLDTDSGVRLGLTYSYLCGGTDYVAHRTLCLTAADTKGENYPYKAIEATYYPHQAQTPSLEIHGVSIGSAYREITGRNLHRKLCSTDTHKACVGLLKVHAALSPRAGIDEVEHLDPTVPEFPDSVRAAAARLFIPAKLEHPVTEVHRAAVERANDLGLAALLLGSRVEQRMDGDLSINHWMLPVANHPTIKFGTYQNPHVFVTRVDLLPNHPSEHVLRIEHYDGTANSQTKRDEELGLVDDMLERVEAVHKAVWSGPVGEELCAQTRRLKASLAPL